MDIINNNTWTRTLNQWVGGQLMTSIIGTTATGSRHHIRSDRQIDRHTERKERTIRWEKVHVPAAVWSTCMLRGMDKLRMSNVYRLEEKSRSDHQTACFYNKSFLAYILPPLKQCMKYVTIPPPPPSLHTYSQSTLHSTPHSLFTQIHSYNCLHQS